MNREFRRQFLTAVKESNLPLRDRLRLRIASLNPNFMQQLEEHVQDEVDESPQAIDPASLLALITTLLPLILQIWEMFDKD